MGLFARKPLQDPEKGIGNAPIPTQDIPSVRQQQQIPKAAAISPQPIHPTKKPLIKTSLETSPFPDQPTRTGAPILPETHAAVNPPIKTPEPQVPSVGESRTYAPLFVKLTKYKEILSNVEILMGTVDALKSQLELQNELSRLQMENSKSLQQSVEKVIGMLSKLDSDFLKPATIGASDDCDAAGSEADGLQRTLTDLRAQIDSLKQDLETPA
jgi:hypothetical protein